MAKYRWWDQTRDELPAGAGAAVPATVVGPVYVTAGAAGGDTNPNTAAIRVPLAGPGGISVPAAVGDQLVCTARFLSLDAAGASYDLAVAVDGDLVWFASSGTATSANEGDPALYPAAGILTGKHAIAELVVQAGHLEDDGEVHFVLSLLAAGTGKTYYSADYPFRWLLVNTGPSA